MICIKMKIYSCGLSDFKEIHRDTNLKYDEVTEGSMWLISPMLNHDHDLMDGDLLLFDHAITCGLKTSRMHLAGLSP